MRAVYAADVEALVEQFRPASILLLDPEGDELVSTLLRRCPECRVDRLTNDDAMAQLRKRGRYPFSFVANTLERMSKAAAGQLIARLRDLHSERLFVLVPIGQEWQGLASTWEMSEFIGYGMRLVSTYTKDAKRLQMYKFDIADYKDTPDWLNAKYWANPERWDKERW